MGCPSSVMLGENLTFSVCTHHPETSILTDADDVPVYRIYEDETATPVLTGDMAKLDDANTTGLYTETISCSVDNGFEYGKTYTIYVTAAVAGSTGGISYGFRVVPDGRAIRKSTAFEQFPFLMTDSTNHAPAVGKTVTCSRAIDGGNFEPGTLANVTEIANGIYTVDFGVGDLDGSTVVLRAIAAGCDDTLVTILPE